MEFEKDFTHLALHNMSVSNLLLSYLRNELLPFAIKEFYKIYPLVYGHLNIEESINWEETKKVFDEECKNFEKAFRNNKYKETEFCDVLDHHKISALILKTFLMQLKVKIVPINMIDTLYDKNQTYTHKYALLIFVKELICTMIAQIFLKECLVSMNEKNKNLKIVFPSVISQSNSYNVSLFQKMYYDIKYDYYSILSYSEMFFYWETYSER